MHVWVIPQDNGMMHQYGAIKTTEKCFNIPNNAKILCFDKLTCEHNNKKSCSNVSFLDVYL